MSKGLDTQFIKARNAEKRGDLAEAESIYAAILEKFPRNARALKGLEQVRHVQDPAPPQAEIDQLMAAYQQGLLAQAATQGEALATRYPRYPLIHNILGITYIGLKEFPNAEKALRRALAINDAFPELHNNLGISLMRQGRLAEANAAFKRALELKPDYANAHNNLGNSLKDQHNLDDAIKAYKRALAINPEYVDALHNLGMALQEQGKLDEAIDCYLRSLSIKADHAEALNSLGNALLEQGNLHEAVASYRNAITFKPDYGEAHYNLGNVLRKLNRLDEAIAEYRTAIAIAPDNFDNHYHLASTLREKGRIDEAIKAFGRALEIRPDNASSLAMIMYLRAELCDWSMPSNPASACHGMVPPFSVLAFEDDPEYQLRNSQAWARETYKQSPLPLSGDQRPPNGKIRVGYFSADFHGHATLYLMAGLLRQHDRERFEIYAYSYGGSSNDEMRQHLLKHVDCFTDAQEMTDQAVAELARSHGLDIAIDLKGYTQQSRSQLFAYRMAPVQINYLGYPGSMGADFIDYLIADAVVIPETEKRFYSEKIIYLPGSYQPNDNQRPIAQTVTTRADFGLPDDAFVFCCFNQSYKVSPREFDIWMRLLDKIKGSVLWLLRWTPWAEANLRKEAEARGIDPARFVFADKLPHAEHLARLRHADLFLDTFNVNAHTTASDALWAGLPVVTKAGRQFAARVCASLLHAIGLPELVAESEETYEALILDLATTPGKLAAIGSKLADNRLTQPLFDTELYTRHLEAAYQAAYQRHVDGLPPDEIVIT